MAISLLLLILIVIVGLIGLISFVIMKGVSGLKIMLLGINITLLGGVLAVDPETSIGGIEYLIVLLGLSISIIGLCKKD